MITFHNHTMIIAAMLASFGTSDAGDLRVSPAEIVLDDPEGTVQVLVDDLSETGRRFDVTHIAAYALADPQIAAVNSAGLLSPQRDGTTKLLIRHGERELRVPVYVRNFERPNPVGFEQQIIPMLTKARCNAGGCHGKAEGQNGFKLSVFGSDGGFDYDALTKEGRGRRLSLTNPDQSLLLKKAAAEIPHGGGRRIEPGDHNYRRLLRWIREGAAFAGDENRRITGIFIEPVQVVLSPEGSQQLRVTALEQSGRQFCVTAQCEFDSNASTIAEVDRTGYVRARGIPGEAAILVRYLGHVAVCRITIPRTTVTFARPPEQNFIDHHVWNKLVALGIPPSELCDDATFLRRVFLDVIGTLPTSSEAQDFLADASPDKRSNLIDRLLERPEYADYWTMRWSDLLRVDKDRVTMQGSVAMTRWLRKHFVENRPYDRLVRDVVTVRGHMQSEGPGALYRVLDTPDKLARSFSQVFLGVRIECAQCHHHPSERWSQDDYYALSGFFTGVVRKNLPSGRMEISVQPGVDVNHPRTGELVPTHALAADPLDLSNLADRRLALADWMTSSDNPFFATAISNRLWSHYFGRGLVEPIDDLRATNPASNEPLLTALADHMRAGKFDLKAFTRTLLNSRAYQLESRTTDANRNDEQNFSHAAHKALPAEVLLDALCQVTGAPEKFNGWPDGARAIEIWDNRIPSYFFRIFGRPVRASVCECERSNEPSISQALHLMNSQEVMEKIRSRAGTARRLADSDRTPDNVIDELFLTSLSRVPRSAERDVLRTAFTRQGTTRRAAVEDVLWTLLNTKEFLYNN